MLHFLAPRLESLGIGVLSFRAAGQQLGASGFLLNSRQEYTLIINRNPNKI